MNIISKKGISFVNILVPAVLILFFAFDFLSYTEHKLQDWVYQRPTSADPNIVVIGIDEDTMAEFGTPDQWSRQLMADAINILNSNEEMKPAVIAMDVLYIGEREDKEADKSLADAAKNGGNVVVASRAVTGYAQSDADPTKVINTTISYEKPYPALAEHASYGNVNCIFDSDSTVRRTTLKYICNGEVLYSFPYEAYKKYIGESDAFIPDYSDIYITYYGVPGEYKQLSFSDIFEEDFEPEYFADSIVFIGYFASGLLDSYHTPIDKEQMAGVEIHANITQMLIEGNIKAYAPMWAKLLIFLAFIAIAMTLASLLDIRILLIAFIALIAVYYFAALLVFNAGFILPLVYPVSVLVLVFIHRLIYGYILEVLEKQKVKATFKKYVDPKLVDKLVESSSADSEAVGLERDIAVLFVDVRGFTPMTEALKDSPDIIVKILNDYLEHTSSSIFDNGGSVDKFIGDATMALFNGFVPLDDYVYKAVKAAWDIVRGADKINAALKEKYNVDIGFGIGVNCGTAIVGNLGPSFRKDYTAIGDTVNTAARLESNAKRSEILISKAVYDIVKDRITAESIGEIPLKGKSIKLEVFSVTGVS